jgi:hypothetical protein
MLLSSAKSPSILLPNAVIPQQQRSTGVLNNLFCHSPAAEAALFAASARDFLIACTWFFVILLACAERETPHRNSIRLKGRRK